MERTTQLQSVWDSMQLWFATKSVDVIINIIVIVLILVIGKVLIVSLRKFAKRLFSKSKKINALMSQFLLKVISILGWIVVLMVVLDRLGVNLAPVIAGLGVTGFILGFAFQETLGNLLAGVMIVLNAPFRIGDFIDVASLMGTVKDMDMMCVTLATPDNKKVILANKLVWGKPITNFSFAETRRVEIGVSIAYSSDVNKAKEIINAILSSYSEVLEEPKPVVAVNKLGDSSVDLVVRPWTKTSDYWPVYFRFQQEVLERFRAEGVEIPFPQMDVHISQS